MKAGWKTTEFWITVAVQIIGLLALAGIFTSEQADQWIKMAETAGALVGMAIANAGYSISRSNAKNAAANVKVVKMQIEERRLIRDELYHSTLP